MLGSPSSPYRNWAPPATHGVYSLFPNDALYQQSGRYHHTLSHPKESLFALSSPPVFHSPASNVVTGGGGAVPVERGITQLELMTKGFNAKRRWESPEAPAVAVKSEAAARSSCGCRHTPSPSSRPILPRGAASEERGCSRTNPVTLRPAGSDVVVGVNGTAVWIKKEPEVNGVTPCQVAEVTTSVVKLEAPPASCRKEAAASLVGNIPVGIAVARQRLQEKGGPNCASVQTDLQSPPVSTMALVQQQCDDRLTNGIAPWASPAGQTTPTPTLWQYPALPVEHLPLPPVGYQLIRDPMTGHFLLIPTTNVLWPTYQAQPMHTTQLTTHDSMQGYLQQQQQQQQPQARANVETKRRLRVKEEKIHDVNPVGLPQHFLLEPEPLPSPIIEIGKRSQATSPVSCLTPPPDMIGIHSQSESEDTSNTVATVSVQDASNQTDTPPVSEDETLAASSDTSASMLLVEGNTSGFNSQAFSTQSNCSSTGVGTDSMAVRDASASTLAENGVTVIATQQVFGNSSQFAVGSGVLSTESSRDLTTNVKHSSDNATVFSSKQVEGEILPSPNSRVGSVGQPNVVRGSCTPPMVAVVDVSGLELLSNSIEQYESHCVMDSNKKQAMQVEVNFNIPKKERLLSDIEISEEKAAESLQLLSAKRLSNASDISSCKSVYERECEQEGLEVNDDFKRLNIQASSNQSPTRSEELNKSSNLFGGLGLLCALAEQRFMEEGCSSTNSVTGNTNLKSSFSLEDVNRNYKTLKSERECKKFIASKQQQYYHSRPTTPVAVLSGVCTSPPPREEPMDASELNMRMKLAELQRQYRETQKELSKLTPKKFDELSPTKRGPGRPRKKCSKFSVESPPSSPKSKPRRELPPPVLEKITDTRWPSDPAPRLKTSKLDILKPPTLTANRILTSAKFKPEMKNGMLGSNGSAGKAGKLPACNVNSAKQAEGNAKTKSTDKTEKLKSKGDICPEKKSGFPCSRASHTFGSKPPMPGENEPLCWFKTPPESLKTEDNPPTLIPSVAITSSSKKRKVGRPKKHLSSQSVAMETIFAKKTKASKAMLVGCLLKSRRPSSSDVPATFKSSSPYTRSPSYIPYKSAMSDRGSSSVEVFSGLDHGYPNGFSDKKKVEETKSHKILPKLKAEAKVKTWTPGDEDDDEEEDDEDWVDRRKEETLALRPILSNTITKPLKRNLPVTKHDTSSATKPKIAKKSASNGHATKPPTNPSPPKTSPKTIFPAKRPATPATPLKTNGNKKRTKRSDSPSSLGTSPGNSESSDDLPLSVFSKKATNCRCLLTEEHLNTDRLRALTVMGGLFYAGELSPIEPPDVYGIKLDGERGNRPHIQSREEVLRDAILEVRVAGPSELPVGTRVCAYWSQQYRCLYPGTVAPNTDDAQQFVSVEFDDGDNGRISVDDIRLLPVDYPIVEYDPNPLQSLGRRRRRTSGASCDSHSRRASADVPTTTTNGRDRPSADAKEEETAPEISRKTNNKTSTITTDNKKQNGVSSSKPRSSAARYDGAVKTEEKGSTDENTTKDDASEQTGTSVDESKNGEQTRSSKERKRLKKRRREKLKRLNSLSPDIAGKKRKKKHRCCDEHCRHRRHHRRHRKHKHRHSHSKESDKRDSSDTISSRLSPVLEQLDILEIQQTAIRQLTNENKLKEEKMKDDVEEKVEVAVKEVVKKEVKEEEIEEQEEEEEEEDVEEEEEVSSSTSNKKTKKKAAVVKAAKKRDRQGSAESRSKMAAFLPARQLWDWAGRGFKRPGGKGRGKKEFYKSIQRGKETIMVGDCAVFLSTGRPDRPYIGRIESMWESWGTNMVVRVKWFYHPEETTGCPSNLKYPGALFESPHVDENDVQTISHKCEVLHVDRYAKRVGAEPGRLATIYDNNDIYYQAGYYDPTTSVLTVEKNVTR